jgi:uncharacterized membrane protein HdeD (DUF308 family)
METKAKEFAALNVPWRRGVGWPVVLIQGLALLAVGIYALTATTSARATVFAIFGAILLVNGLGAVLAAFRQPPARGTAYRALRGGVAITTGALALASRFVDTLDKEDARIILGFGFVAVGLIGLAALFMAREQARFPVGSLVWQLVLVALGITVWTGSEDSSSRLDLVGWIAIVLGALLVALAALIQQGKVPSADDGAAQP